MKGLPVWMLAGLAVLAVLLLGIGWNEPPEAGYLLFLNGIIFLVLPPSLQSAGGTFVQTRITRPGPAPAGRGPD